EETPFHRVAGQSERFVEVLERGFVPSTPKLELTEGRRIKRICGETIAVANRADLFEPASLASITVYPPTTSFASAYGPSFTHDVVSLVSLFLPSRRLAGAAADIFRFKTPRAKTSEWPTTIASRWERDRRRPADFQSRFRE